MVCRLASPCGRGLNSHCAMPDLNRTAVSHTVCYVQILKYCFYTITSAEGRRLCFYLCLFVCLSARLLTKLRREFGEIFWRCGVAHEPIAQILTVIQ